MTKSRAQEQNQEAKAHKEAKDLREEGSRRKAVREGRL